MQQVYEPYPVAYNPYSQAPAYMPQRPSARPTPAGYFYWVRGLQMADNWPIDNNEIALLLDELDDVMYIRTHDQQGRPCTIVYDTIQRKPQSQIDMANIERMIAGMIEQRFQQLQPQNQPTKTRAKKEDAANAQPDV